MTAWSEAELSRLKDLTRADLSAGTIACRLNAEFDNERSRNSVIGKIIRGEGAFGRLVPRGVPRRSKPGASLRPAKASPRPRRKVSETGGERQVPADSGEASAVAAYGRVENLPAPLPVAYLDAVFADRCLHFVGDPFGPAGPDMPVCGAERAQDVIGTRYCRRHLASQHRARVA